MIPKTAAIEMHYPDDEWPMETNYGTEVTYENNRLTWMTGDDHGHAQDVVSFSDEGLYTEFVLADEAGTVRVRDLDPYDGVALSSAGVPQPIEVIKAEIESSGGIVAQELSAAVAADNTVVTLLLDTGIGLYARFSGDWHKLAADSTALEDTYLIDVAPESVDVFDAADMARTTLLAFDLPRFEDFDGVQIKVNPEPVSEPSTTVTEEGIIVASGAMIPAIHNEDDLENAIRYARYNVGAQWYVKKRASSLGMSESIPAEWR